MRSSMPVRILALCSLAALNSCRTESASIDASTSTALASGPSVERDRWAPQMTCRGGQTGLRLVQNLYSNRDHQLILDEGALDLTFRFDRKIAPDRVRAAVSLSIEPRSDVPNPNLHACEGDGTQDLLVEEVPASDIAPGASEIRIVTSGELLRQCAHTLTFGEEPVSRSDGCPLTPRQFEFVSGGPTAPPRHDFPEISEIWGLGDVFDLKIASEHYLAPEVVAKRYIQLLGLATVDEFRKQDDPRKPDGFSGPRQFYQRYHAGVVVIGSGLQFELRHDGGVDSISGIKVRIHLSTAPAVERSMAKRKALEQSPDNAILEDLGLAISSNGGGPYALVWRFRTTLGRTHIDAQTGAVAWVEPRFIF